MIAETLIFGFLIVLLLYKLMKRPEGLPPGDIGYPIIGNLVLGQAKMKRMINEHRKKYGDIFCVRFGSMTIVFLADFHMIKEAFAKPELSARPFTKFFQLPVSSTGYGLIASNGQIWQVNRRFALKTLKDFGLGKSRIETIIENEVEAIIDEFSKRVDKPTEIDCTLNAAILNVIWTLVADQRFSIHDKEIHKFVEVFLRDQEIFEGNLMLLDYFPWLDKLLPEFIKNNYMCIGELKSNLDFLHSTIQKQIEGHMKNLDKENPKDYIDMYLLQLDNMDNPDFIKDIKNLLYSIYNIFIAGSDTTASSLRWFFLYMCKYTDIQERIQKDIDTYVPKDRLPSLQDRENLAFHEATISEVNRSVSLIPSGIMHMALEDTTLNGYKIPKGTVITPCIEVCHNNPKYFDLPKEFRPQRFLDSNGKLVTKKEGYLPFSIGKRICLGEALAKTELFLFTAAVLQNFKVSAPKNVQVDLTPLLTKSPVVNYPPPYKIVFTKRN